MLQVLITTSLLIKLCTGVTSLLVLDKSAYISTSHCNEI